MVIYKGIPTHQYLRAHISQAAVVHKELDKCARTEGFYEEFRQIHRAFLLSMRDMYGVWRCVCI